MSDPIRTGIATAAAAIAQRRVGSASRPDRTTSEISKPRPSQTTGTLRGGQVHPQRAAVQGRSGGFRGMENGRRIRPDIAGFGETRDGAAAPDDFAKVHRGERCSHRECPHNSGTEWSDARIALIGDRRLDGRLQAIAIRRSPGLPRGRFSAFRKQ